MGPPSYVGPSLVRAGCCASIWATTRGWENRDAPSAPSRRVLCLAVTAAVVVDYFNAGAGNDILTGGDGLDYLYGLDDNDTLHVNDGGTDYSYCGNGTDDASDNDIYDATLQDCELT